jgi:decaprenylphospho-beta-D-erythro-pentofuranosid-2-ulose 2-reductase
VSAPAAHSVNAPGGATANGALPRRVVVLGGSSEIAQAIVAEMSRDGACATCLVGRDGAALAAAADRLRRAGVAEVHTQAGLDALDTDSHRGALAAAVQPLGGVDVILVAVGVLGERGGLPDDIAAAVGVLEVNVVGCGSLLMESARLLRRRGGGTIVVLSSLAAERPRRSNVVYGASKAALDDLSQGLADALRPAGVRIMVVRPGFVHTRMTAGLTAAPLACSPEVVAKAVVRGLDGGAQTVWAPGSLRWVALIMRLMPRALFRRLAL